MYFGHFGIGFALKKFGNGLSLGWLFLAVQFVDILAMNFLILGIERANVVPGFTATSSLEYVYYPFSHSLVAFLVWAGVLYAIFRIVKVKPGLRKSRVALIMALGVLSHFVLDVIVHTQDIPILFTDSIKLGFGLWNYSPIINYLIEGVILLVGLYIYLRVTKASNFLSRYGIVFLVTIMFILNAILMSGQTLSDSRLSAGLYLILNTSIILITFWLDKKRTIRTY